MNPTTGAYSELLSVTQDTMLKASDNRAVIGFAEANISDGRWDIIRPLTGEIVRREGYTDGTSWFNYEIGVSRLGMQIAIPTYGGTFVYDRKFNKIHTYGTYASEVAAGVAYHPKKTELFLSIANTDIVRSYWIWSFAHKRDYHTGITFDSVGNWGFVDGRLRFSCDGGLLFATVKDGVLVLTPQ